MVTKRRHSVAAWFGHVARRHVFSFQAVLVVWRWWSGYHGRAVGSYSTVGSYSSGNSTGDFSRHTVGAGGGSGSPRVETIHTKAAHSTQTQAATMIEDPTNWVMSAKTASIGSPTHTFDWTVGAPFRTPNMRKCSAASVFQSRRALLRGRVVASFERRAVPLIVMTLSRAAHSPETCSTSKSCTATLCSNR